VRVLEIEDPSHPYWSGFTDADLRELLTSGKTSPGTRKIVATVYMRRKAAAITDMGGTNEKRVD
jgi:hypothetical protein